MPERTPSRGEPDPSPGYDPKRASGSLRPPLYQTSTFVFSSAEEGKRFFELAYGLDDPGPGEDGAFLYSRLDNPNLTVVEARISQLEGGEDSLLFNSGMAAITTLMLSYLRAGDLVVASSPVYGGTSTLLRGLMSDFGVTTLWFASGDTEAEIQDRISASGRQPGLVYVETPSNPTIDIFDLAMASRIARDHDVRLIVDNTFLGPLGQRPLDQGADLVVESATKYLGGHSDLTAGTVCGRSDEIGFLRQMRYRLGSTASPMTAWLLTRSLDTFELRVERQTSNAVAAASYLHGHPKVTQVNHLSLLTDDDPRRRVFDQQCLTPGAMIAFEVAGGVEGAFRFLNGCRILRQATSLGGTESLVSHPWTTSHSTTPVEEKRFGGITEGLIRFSVGVEPGDDILQDLETALDQV